MTIQKISSSYSEGVESEIVALDKQKNIQYALLNSSLTVDDYIYNKQTSSIAVKEYTKLLTYLPKGRLKILDIGVGMGQSSAYLASLGHTVFALEPNPVYCDIIEQLSIKMDLPITPVEGVAEDLLNLKAREFDVVFFNASLHHCDQPDLALQNSFDLLKPGGYIVLASENWIRPWITKKRWHYLMENFPIEMGHYGGNEHIYYNWEYIKLLSNNKFDHIKITPSALETEPLERLENILTKQIGGVRVYNATKVLMRFIFYIISSKILKSRWLFNLLGRWSLVTANYIGQKPGASN